MTLRTCISGTLLFVGSAWAADAPGQPADSASVAPTSPPAQVDEVLALAPADASFIAYAAEAKTAFNHPVLAEGFPSVRSDLRPLFDSLAKTFDGAAMISLSGVPINPLTWQVTVAARIGIDREELFRRLTYEIVPAWNRSETAPGHVQFWDDGKFGYLQLIGPIPLSMTLAIRDDVVFGSTIPGLAEGWHSTGGTNESFVDTEEFARINVGRREPVGTLLYLDMRPLLSMAAASLNQNLPSLYEALQLDHVEFVALVGGKTAETTRVPKPTQQPEPTERARPVDPSKSREQARRHLLRVAIGLEQVEPGLWHLLASTPSSVSLARLFPADTTFFVHGSMERASGIADDICAFLAAIDKEISDEYEQELGEFKRDIGFDPHTEFLANIVKEWAFGVRVPRLGNRLLALRLESVSTFKAHMHRLRLFYQLETYPVTYRGITIEHAARKLGPFAYAVVDDVLLVSPEARAIMYAIDAALDDTGLARTKAFEGVIRRTAPRTSKFIFANLAALLAEAVESEEAARFPHLVQLVKSGAGMGLSVVPHERIIALEIVTGEGPAGRVIDVLASVLVPSLQRARELSMRAASLSNAKNIVTSCMFYATHHKGQWPKSLDQLVASGVLGNKEDAMRILLSNPYQPGQDGTDKPYYLYRYIPDPSEVKSEWEEVVISEPEIHDGGAVFGFMDGHAEWITSPRAEELLSIMRSGQ